MAEQTLDPLTWPVLGVLLDSGVYGHNWTSSATPIECYIGTTIDGYAGTTVPGATPATRYLIGRGGSGFWPTAMQSTTVGSNGTYYDSTSYKDSISTHMSCGGLSSVGAELTPSRYTGLMRLAVQAQIGAARNPDRMVVAPPTDCSPQIDL